MAEFPSNDFDKWLKYEHEKDKTKVCNQRKGECYGCPYEEDCQYEELLNSIDEW